MESITIIPRNKKQGNVIKSFFKEMDIPFKEEESLDAKIFRLYEEKHYNSQELEWFFSIPEKFRVDPFETVDDGDIFWADQRNIDKLEKDLAQGRKDLENGKTITLKPTDNAEDFWEQIREYEI